jgi:hypothetical protein
MWTATETESYQIRQRRYVKKRPRELAAVLDNLDTFFRALSEGVKPTQAKASFGFIHKENLGVVSIDQRGGGPNLAQTRLYVYPDEKKEVLYLITLGDKASQRDDISTCAAFIKAHIQEVSEQYGKELS